MKKIVFLFLFICSGANSAQLVGSEILLCNNGYSADGSTCTTYGAGECESGYYDLTPSTTSFFAPMGNFCKTNYNATTLPDTTIELVYHGDVVGSEILLCDNGYSANGTTCTTYEMGDCSADYYDVEINATTFVSSVNDTCSAAGYQISTLPEGDTKIIYYGVLVGSEILLCDNGYSANGSTCTTYGTSNCPTGYYNTNGETTTFAKLEGACSSGYKQYEAEDSCGFEPASTCISYCENGEATTGIGGCSTFCGEGVTTLRTSTGLKYPLWTTKQTTPSLNVGFANGNRCYMSLTDEPTDNQSMWFQWANNRMHATK